MDQFWTQDQVVTPQGASGPNPPPGMRLVPLTAPDPAKPVELQGKQLDNEGQALTNEGKRIDLQIKQAEAASKPDPALKKAITGLGLDELLTSVGRAREQIKTGWATGIPGQIAGMIPGTPRKDFLGVLDGLKGGITLEKLQALREQSATGSSGMGTLSEQEGERLAASVAALRDDMSRDELEKSLDIIERHAKSLQAIANGEDPNDKGVQKKYGIAPLPGQETAGGQPGDIGFSGQTSDPRVQSMNPQQKAAYEAWFAANPNPTPEQLNAFLPTIGVQTFDNAQEIIDAHKKDPNAPLNTDVQIRPDISDVRGQGGVSDSANAAIRGAFDTLTLGTGNKLIAVGDTILNGGTFDQNLTRQYAIDEYDRQNHGWLRLGGQVAGGAPLPLFEARTAAELAKIGAAYGAAYGAGSSEHLADVPGNTLFGGATGALAAWGGAKLLNKLAGTSPAAELYASGQKYGMDLSIGDVRGLGSKATERLLDVQPGSAGVMNKARTNLAEQTVAAVDNVAGTYGPTTSFRGMGEAAQKGAKKWIDKFERVSSKAYDAIPISPKADASTSNTVQALKELTTIFESNPKMAQAFKNTKLNAYLEALDPDKGGKLSWNDLKQFRSRVGEEIGEQRFSESPTKTELRRLYAALSEDMRDSAAAQGEGAIRAFERANDLYRQGQERIDNALTTILGDDSMKSPEAAAAKLQAIVREGKSSSDLQKVHAVWKSLPADERGEVANGLIRLLGQPANSEGRDFNPQTFIRNLDSMAPEAKNLIFGGPNKELRQNLDEFSGVIRGMAANNSTRNTSNTAMGLAGLIGFGGGGVPGLLTQVVGSYGAARLWTNPRFVRWATGYAKMLRGAAKAGTAPTAAGIKTHARLLDKIAAAEPAIAQEALGLRKALLGANDNMQVAASDSDENKKQ